MWLEYRNADTRAVRMTDEEAAWLHNFLVLPDKAGHFGPQARTVTLYDLRTQTFPSGLLPLVVEQGRKEGYEIEVRDLRGVKPIHDTNADLDWLYDHQQEAVELIFEKERGIICAPTGSGKGEVMCALARLYPKAHIVYLVDRKDLVDNIVKRLRERVSEKVGQVGDNVRDIQRLTVCNAHSLRKPIKTGSLGWFFTRTTILVIDEVHTAGGATMYLAAQAFKNARIRVGFSATPFDRADDRSLMVAGCTGEIIHHVQFEQMVDTGVIAKPVVRAHRVPIKPERIRYTSSRVGLGKAWAEGYAAQMLSPERMAAVRKMVQHASKPCLVLLESIDHGEAVAKALTLHGMPCEFASGESSSKDRRRMIDEIESGARDVLVANRIFKTGVDMPAIRSVVSVGAGKSVISNIQSVGRGTRRRDKDGNVVKDSFDFHDLADRDCGCRHLVAGVAHYDHTACKWFDQHSRKRLAAYRRAGFEIVEHLE
jgi:superfamily II DNA or RNA helicase